MSDTDVVLLYSKIGRVSFDGTRDALDFINIIEPQTRTRHIYYQRILVVELSV